MSNDAHEAIDQHVWRMERMRSSSRMMISEQGRDLMWALDVPDFGSMTLRLTARLGESTGRLAFGDLAISISETEGR